MKRREFSAAAGLRPAPAASGRPGAAQAQGGAPVEGTALRAPGARRCRRRRRRQDRGDRVLLVRLPALQRLRADARGLGQEAAAPTCVFRRVPVAFRDEPFVAAPAHLLRARGDGQARRDAPQGVRRDPRRAPAARQAGRDRRLHGARTASTAPSSSRLYNSFSVQTKARQATQLHARPTRSTACRRSASHGRYYTSGTLAGCSSGRWRSPTT